MYSIITKYTHGITIQEILYVLNMYIVTFTLVNIKCTLIKVKF